MAEDEKVGARKCDQVSQNSIWREHVKKERQMLTLNENFRLNPHALTVISSDHPDTLRVFCACRTVQAVAAS